MVKKATGRAPNVWACSAKGLVGAAAMTILGAMVLAKLVDGEVLEREQIGYGSMVVLVLSAFLGAKLGQTGAGHQGVKTGIASGLGYFLLLLAVNALFFGGSYSGLGVTLLLILLGTGVALMPRGRGGRSPRRKHYKIPK